ncbi:hypothetical protein MMC29_007030, partial [Sticta canariensis]|nr:hypothetical protein [Sticta canariensis]
MSLTRREAEAIRDWVPYPSSLSSSVASPTIERFLRNFAVAGAVLRSQIPPAICSTPASLEIIKGLLSNLFDYGAPLKIFAYAGEVLASLPRTEEFAEQWRLMCPDNPSVDQYDINDPKGLDFPSIAGSPHRLPSYYPPEPRTPAHRSELLVLVVLCAAARAKGSPLRPINDVGYWSLAVAGGRWSDQQLMAAEEVLHASLKTVIIADAGAAAMRAEMEKV